MTSVKRNRFSGAINNGLFEGAKNSVFFTPALLDPRTGNEIEIESLSVTVKNNEVYSAPVIEDTRQFRFGVNSSRTNSTIWRTYFKIPTVIATLVQVVPPGPTTTIKIR